MATIQKRMVMFGEAQAYFPLLHEKWNLDYYKYM